jgi:SAM-dependent methyltransferase
MTGQPDRQAVPDDFEFAALQEASRYRAALIREFRPCLRGHVLEVGAGIGQITEKLRDRPEIERLVSVEPDPRFAARLRGEFPGLEIIQGTIDDVPAAWSFDCIVSINVLEHIEADERELSLYFQRLSARRGTLCLFVPARPEILAPIDRDFGHRRRYRRPELRRKLAAAGFRPSRLVYFNLAGYFSWWWTYSVLKKRRFSPAMVRLFDRWFFPLQYALESRLLRPPFGMSLVAIAAAYGGATS